ncbi:MAG: PspC domain-containing protein, partial [Verrucomicrobia bacterium]|nr:PspC domain-containing protein [Cytophagales bacterium]
MIKTISINISGLIFNIEEDAYERLQHYLSSVEQYFSGYQGSKEIVADIESRIAEIFYTKVSNTKQVITLEDVEKLIATMGDIADFEATEGEEHAQAQKNTGFSETSQAGTQTQTTQRRLFRDTKHKVLGGVSSGIAYHLRMDPIWVRLVFLLATFAYGIVLIPYIILWIVLPGDDSLKEDEQVKRLYRNPDKKVVGGVASGLAAYFGNDADGVTLWRIIFVVGIFLGGFSVIAYFIFWIITPEAKTLTEKMQMQGQPVTLSNIEDNIKKNLNIDGSKEETVAVKVLLFPFRVLTQIFNALVPVAGSLAKVIFVLIGLCLLLTSVATLFGLVVGIGILTGTIESGGFFRFDAIPRFFHNGFFPFPLAFFTFLSVAIPIIFLGIAGAVLVSQRSNLLNRNLALALVGIWMVSLAGLAFTGNDFSADFRKEGVFNDSQTFDTKGKVLVLTSQEAGLEDYRSIEVNVQGYAGNIPKLEKRFFARGKNRDDALGNARNINYKTAFKNDSILVFDSNFDLKAATKFREQRLRMTLYLPYNQLFTVENEVHFFNDFNKGERYQFTKEKGLVCLTCLAKDSLQVNSEGMLASEEFDEIEVDGPFDIRIRQGERFAFKTDAS